MQIYVVCKKEIFVLLSRCYFKKSTFSTHCFSSAEYLTNKNREPCCVFDCALSQKKTLNGKLAAQQDRNFYLVHEVSVNIKRKHLSAWLVHQNKNLCWVLRMSSHFTMKYSISSEFHQSQANYGGLYTSLQARNKFLALESGFQPAHSQKYYGNLKNL